MEGSAFDRLTRAMSAAGSRRRLLGVLTSGLLAGLVMQLDDDATEARRKRRGRKRSHRPGKDKDNRKGKRKGNGKGKGLGGASPDPCTAHLQPCTSADQCCATDHTACTFNNWVIAENVCCSTLGGACSTGGPSGDCCVLDDEYAYCSPDGACGGQGAVCRFDDVCVSGQCCKAHPTDDHGTCSGPDGCCRAHLASCTSADQCCSTENTACTYNNWVIAENVCCSTLGGPCSTGGPSGDCCVLNDDYAYCSPEGTCGGQGAECRFDDVCLSGQCCKAHPSDDQGTCSGPGGC